MARIPQAQRRIFNTTITNVDPTSPAAIGAAAAAGQAVAQVASTVGNQLRIQRERELTVQAAEFNSRFTLQAHQQAQSIFSREDVQRNPSLATQEVGKITQGMLQSDEFNSQPQRVQQAIRIKAASLNQQLGQRALKFQNDQTFNNTVNSFNKTLGNFELQALDGSVPLSDILKSNAALHAAAVKGGSMPLAKAEASLMKSNQSITMFSFNRLIANKDFDGAQDFIDDEDTRELLGSKNVLKAQNTINEKRQERANNNLKDFQKDPAKLAIRNGANPDDPQSLLDNQFIETTDKKGETVRIPVPPEQSAVMTNDQASFIAFNLNNATNVDVLDIEFQQLQQKFGANFPIAINNLKKNGLSDNLVSYAMMGPEDRLQKETLLQLSQGGAEEAKRTRQAAAAILKKGTELTGMAVQTSDVSNKVAENLSEYVGILAQEGFPPNQLNNFLKTSELLAFQYVLQGRSVDESARLATEWLLNNYSVGEINNGKFRVPIEHNVNEVERALSIINDSLTINDIQRPDVLSGIEGITFEELKETSRWELNADQSGLILVDQFGRPIRNAGGFDPIEVKFNQVQRINQARFEAEKARPGIIDAPLVRPRTAKLDVTELLEQE